MRIAHVSCIAPPDVGGIGSVAADEVASLCARGVDAYQISLTTHAGFRIGNAGSIHALPLLVQDADIVHLHYPFFGTQGALVRLRRTGVVKKLVMTLHMDAMARGWKGALFDLQRRAFQPRLLQAADARIVSSKDYASHGSFAPWVDHAIEIPFGVDVRRFVPGIHTSDVPTAVFVGGMDAAHAFKGVEVLLRALVFASDVHLVLVGDGTLRRQYEALAKTLGVANRCLFRGRVTGEELVRVYQDADMCVLSSTSSAEAFGMVLLEAQACGIPVIASDLPGVRTVVRDGETGLLVPPCDEAALGRALTNLANDAVYRAQMGRCARIRACERFSQDAHVDALLQVYQRV